MTLDYGKVAPTEVNPNSEKEIQMSTKERDCEASALQAEGLTWVEVAERLGLANGGVPDDAPCDIANATPTALNQPK